jgi:hypothetical protein
MYSSGCKLVFKKRQNKWQNSTDSCHVLTMNDGTFQAWSYGEVIFQYDYKLKKYIFNYYGFSNTTNVHQIELRSFLEKRVTSKDIITCSMTTLNNGFKYEHLEVDDSNLGIVDKYFPNKVNHFKSEIEKKIAEKIESDRIKRLRRNIENVNYKTKKGFLKAIKKDIGVKNGEKIRYVNLFTIVKLHNLGIVWDEVRFYDIHINNIAGFFNAYSWQKLEDMEKHIERLEACLKFFKGNRNTTSELKKTDTYKLSKRLENLDNVF